MIESVICGQTQARKLKVTPAPTFCQHVWAFITRGAWTQVKLRSMPPSRVDRREEHLSQRLLTPESMTEAQSGKNHQFKLLRLVHWAIYS